MFLASYSNDRSNTRVKPRQLITRDLKPIERFVEQWDLPERALYFCVSTLLPGRQQRRKDTLAELTGLHADLDFKGIDATPAEIEKALRQLQLPPSCINFSGHGFHCYWLFREALAATPENIERASRQRCGGSRDHLAGDPSVAEVARLMRLPGTHNSKNGEWIEVTTVAERPSGYELEELEDGSPMRHRFCDGATSPTATATIWKIPGSRLPTGSASSLRSTSSNGSPRWRSRDRARGDSPDAGERERRAADTRHAGRRGRVSVARGDAGGGRAGRRRLELATGGERLFAICAKHGSPSIRLRSRSRRRVRAKRARRAIRARGLTRARPRLRSRD